MKALILSFLLLSFMQKEEVRIEKIDEAGIQFELPGKWNMVARQESDYYLVYYYKREPIVDDSGRNVIPNISIILEDLKEENDVVLYSAQKRAGVPFDIDDVFTHESDNAILHFKNAIGYQGRYMDDKGLEHKAYMVHMINNHKGIQIICDITSDLFDEYSSEFTQVLSSIKKISK